MDNQVSTLDVPLEVDAKPVVLKDGVIVVTPHMLKGNTTGWFTTVAVLNLYYIAASLLRTCFHDVSIMSILPEEC